MIDGIIIALLGITWDVADMHWFAITQLTGTLYELAADDSK